jgi:hypothetical protein
MKGAIRLVPLDAITGFQRRWPVRELWAIGVLIGVHLAVLTVTWAKAGLDLALFATAALAITLLALGETTRDRGRLNANRIWWVLADEWGLPIEEIVERTVTRHGHNQRSQRVKAKQPIPPGRKTSDGTGQKRPRVQVIYKPGTSRWKPRKPADIDRIIGNYHGSNWREHDRAAIITLRKRLESKLQITLRTVHTPELKQADLIELHQAAPLPGKLTLDHVTAAYQAGGKDLRGRLIVGFVAPDTTGPHIVPVTFTDPVLAQEALDAGLEPPGPETFYVLAVDPRKVPHFRVHGATGRGKTVTLDDLVYAFLLYASVHGDGMGGVLAADCKLAGTFVKWKHTGQVHIPRTEEAVAAQVHQLKGLMDVRAGTLNRSADEIIDAWNNAEDPPLVPAFEPVLAIIDEYASLYRWLKNEDDLRKNRDGTPPVLVAQFQADLADLVQKGRALDMHVGVASQSANVEGAGGAKFPSDVRAQAELVINMGPTSEEGGRVTFGTKEGAEWARLIPDEPGYAGVAVGPEFYVVKMPYVYDPVAHGKRNMRVDQATRLSAHLNSGPQEPAPEPPAPGPEPAPEPEAEAPTVQLFRLDTDAGTGPLIDGEEEDPGEEED